jgi:hypothetical protein
MKLALLAAIPASASIALAAPADAQATRTWVSGVGDDVNPCSRTAPCKTFAGAISKTAAGGEISVLDPAGYGAVTITKSISIVAAGAEGSILAGSVNGITVNTGPNDAVYLKGLMIEGAGTGLNGIRLVGGGSLTIDDCVIRGFQAGNGIDIQASFNARVFVSDTLVARNTGGISVGLNPAPLPPGASQPTVSVMLDRTQLVQNAGAGVKVSAGSLSVSNSTVFGNGSGLSASGGGQIISFGNNAIAGNGGQDGAPTSRASLQ